MNNVNLKPKWPLLYLLNITKHSPRDKTARCTLNHWLGREDVFLADSGVCIYYTRQPVF